MNQSSNFNVVGNQTAFRAISYTLVFLMMACFVMAIGILIQNTMPGWSSDIISGIILFIVIDRLYTYERMKFLKPFSREWTLTHGAQWVVVVLFIKVLLSFAKGSDALQSDISSFTRGSLGALFNLEFIVTLLLAILTWQTTGQFLALLDEIGLDKKSALPEPSILVPKDFLPAHRRLVNLTLQLGIGLAILTALTRINLNALYNVDATLKGLRSFSGAEAGALFYFIFGFALLCVSRLMSLQTRWNRQHIPVASDTLARQWGVYGAFFLLILMVVVGFLSSGDTVGLFSLIRILLGFLFRTFLFIGQLILFFIYMILGIPSQMLDNNIPVTKTVTPTPTPLPPQVLEEPAITAANPTLALIRSILLWGLLLLIFSFSLVRYLRQHGGLQSALRKMPIANWLFFLWEWLRKNADTTRRTLSRTIADVWQRIRSRTEGTRLFPPSSLIRLSALDPRRQIYFFYLAMVRRGSDRGMERTPSQTPAEYAATLERVLPSVHEEVHSMTEAFVEARYSSRRINAEEANLVKTAWKRVRWAFQLVRKPTKSQMDIKK